MFRHSVREAEDIGMVVNTKKTTMMCISDSSSFEADAYILDADGERIGFQKEIRALRMRFSNRPSMAAHIEHIRKSFRSRLWILRNLKNCGFTQEELTRVYATMIRPVSDYGCVVYHSSLTDEQDEELDRLQNQALKCILGPGLSGRRMRELAGVCTLRQRREDLCDKFAAKLAANPHFSDWFPIKSTRASTRSGVKREVYLEKTARCSRLADSPLFYFRRRLNGKAGKTYGKRYAEYRED